MEALQRPGDQNHRDQEFSTERAVVCSALTDHRTGMGAVTVAVGFRGPWLVVPTDRDRWLSACHCPCMRLVRKTHGQVSC